ncbi:hypothetical protein OKA05_17545 [Luteolibacter arcticus]|uniref:Uncharacterized protein n=1 Tax=Luteolibacter arcticus TaxID=1581411 RepID=A0ABT3GLH9_9BACT|nr:hypothetical protein [Luteolibacter arcticus]MCW1924375.1 hypothetical protein [Luteolibacter arcticus]
MKPLPTLGLVAVAVAITVAIEEIRISDLRHQLSEKAPSSETQPGSSQKETSSLAAAGDTPAAPTKAGERPAKSAAAAENTADDDDGGLGKTVRKMWDNPAGKAMMNQGVKVAVAMMYEDFMETLELSKEEQTYFKNLLGQGIADQQEIGMKMMGATPEERVAMAKELEERKKTNEEAIKAFLNSEEDSKRFADYQARLPERQQLDGIRATFGAKNAPLTPEVEGRLVDAMYQARTTSKGADFSGPDAWSKMADGGLVKNFEQNWDAQEQTLMKEAGTILDPTQLAAFKDYRQQVKEMQLASMKMAEKMMSEEDEEEETDE